VVESFGNSVKQGFKIAKLKLEEAYKVCVAHVKTSSHIAFLGSDSPEHTCNNVEHGVDVDE
jgi:hypothetical protein